MSVKTIARAVLFCLGVTAAVHTAIASDDTLEHAKSLYASAAYDEALVVLDKLEEASPPEDPTSIAQYRVFCLLALERRDEARKGIDRMLRDRPLYVPSETEASPRILSVFREVRRQTLPKIALERYGFAKAAFDRKDSSAAQQFDDLVTLLNDPDLKDAPALSDLKEVASAFRDLAKSLTAAATPTSAPAQAREATPAPPPAAPQVEAQDIIYTAADTDVTPPVARSQPMPPWRPSSRQEAMQEYRGALRLLIDQSGAVLSVSMPAGTRPAYDSQLMKAARGWTFVPAQKQGRPVRYLKVVQIQLKPTVS
jgi:tetratricopeptide (TPR) repeat protein